jgi:hypothetical protein
VTATAERAIHRNVAGHRPQAVQYLGDHDRQMHSGGRLAGRDDLLDVSRKSLGVQFLVLLVELPRIPAGIPHPSGRRGRGIRWHTTTLAGSLVDAHNQQRSG